LSEHPQLFKILKTTIESATFTQIFHGILIGFPGFWHGEETISFMEFIDDNALNFVAKISMFIILLNDRKQFMQRNVKRSFVLLNHAKQFHYSPDFQGYLYQFIDTSSQTKIKIK
jgi:hypothetical protein